jgi:hypothetical protein
MWAQLFKEFSHVRTQFRRMLMEGRLKKEEKKGDVINR